MDVELIGYDPNPDLLVVNAARVSMGKRTEEIRDKDVRLIHYLATHNHWTPFAHPIFHFRIKMPIFVAREWFRHTVGLARNEVSRRYVDDDPDFFLPDSWRARADNVKQGSGEDLPEDVQQRCNISYWEHLRGAERMYKAFLAEGVCPEQARMLLPQSMMTEFVETGSLAAYARICNLRLDSHAQKEIQVYAKSISRHLAAAAPISWEALTRKGGENVQQQ